MVEKAYNHKPLYLIAKENGEIKGVLPLFLMKSIIFEKKLVSVLFAPYGGVCADSETVKNALIEKAKRIISELDMGDKVNNNESIYYQLCENENGA